MANLFGGTDLFGNKRQQFEEFTPTYQDPTSGVVDVSGNVVGSTNLNKYDYASPESAQQLSQLFGMPLQTSMASGPGASANPQYELATGTPGHALNAGRVGQQLSYATQGRYNADTGQYDKEPMEVVMARIAADVAPPLLGSQTLPTSTIKPPNINSYPNYIGAHPYNVGKSVMTGQPMQRSTPQTTQPMPTQTSMSAPRPNASNPASASTQASASAQQRARAAQRLRAMIREGRAPQPQPQRPGQSSVNTYPRP